MAIKGKITCQYEGWISKVLSCLVLTFHNLYMKFLLCLHVPQNVAPLSLSFPLSCSHPRSVCVCVLIFPKGPLFIEIFDKTLKHGRHLVCSFKNNFSHNYSIFSQGMSFPCTICILQNSWLCEPSVSAIEL